MRICVIVSFILILGASCNTQHQLFDNADGYRVVGDANWKFTNNEIIGTVENGSGFVISENTYSDFDLEMEFMPDSTINSGVFIRCSDAEISPVNCYEINIWDLHPNQDYRTGSIVLRSKPLVKLETNYRWNKYRIKSIDNHIQVWINNTLTADITDDTRKSGSIAIQASGTGLIRFRNIRIRQF